MHQIREEDHRTAVFDCRHAHSGARSRFRWPRVDDDTLRRVRRRIDVILIDKTDAFVFGFSKLDVMFGRQLPQAVRHAYRDIVKPGVRFVQTTMRSIEPATRPSRHRRRARSMPTSLVVALGADLDSRRRRDWSRAATSSTRCAGAFAVRDVLADLRRRSRDRRRHVNAVQVPARAERDGAAAPRLPRRRGVHEALRDLDRDAHSARRCRRRPTRRRRCSPRSPNAASVGRRGHARAGARAGRKVAILSDGTEMPYDLFLGVPDAPRPAVVVESGLATGPSTDGCRSSSRRSRRTSPASTPSVTSPASAPRRPACSPRAQAGVVGRRPSRPSCATRTGARTPTRARLCYVEFGAGEVAKVDVTFLSGEAPTGVFADASLEFAGDKVEFGASRTRRWFGRDWTNV